MTQITETKLTSLEEILKEGAKKVSTDKLYWGITNEAYQMECEVEALANKTEAKAKVLAEGLMDKNNTFEEALKELKLLNDLRNNIKCEEIKENVTQILDITQSIILKEMQQVRCDIRKYNKEVETIKNTDGNTAMKINEEGITVNGVLKINQEQEQKMGVINYLPAETMKCNLDPRFIGQVTEEVIKKMKEPSLDFKELPIETKIKLDSKDVRKVENSSGAATKNSKTLTVENILGNNEKAMKKIKEAMELIHENINMIMNEKSMNRTITAILEDLMSSERQLLSTLVYLRITNDKQTR